MAGSPFGPDDVADIAERPMKALEKYYPGVTEFLAAKDLTWNGQKQIFSIEHARRKLSYRPKCTFERYLAQLGFPVGQAH